MNGGNDETNSKITKVIVVGKQGTGKTSIIKRYTWNQYDPFSQPTIAASNSLKQLNYSCKISFNLSIWDIAGQDRYKSLTKNFVRNCMGCIIVCDTQDESSLEDALNWKSIIEKECEYSIPIILAQNKSDLLNPIFESNIQKYDQNTNNNQINSNIKNNSNNDNFNENTMNKNQADSQICNNLNSNIKNQNSNNNNSISNNNQLKESAIKNNSMNDKTQRNEDNKFWSEEYLNNFAEQNNFNSCIQVSALNGHNINELFKLLVDHIVIQQGDNYLCNSSQTERSISLSYYESQITKITHTSTRSKKKSCC